MPSVYLDRPFLKVAQESCERIKRDADGNPNVPIRDGLYQLLSDDAKAKVRKERGYE